VTFSPGVYIITGTNSLTGVALSILGGTVTGNGVLFYITDSTFDPSSGAPDSGDGNTAPSSTSLVQIPSVVITGLLPGSSFSPLADGSAFNNLLIYQRRQDSRPIVVYANLPGNMSMQGTVYTKWGSVFYCGSGTVNLTLVAGTVQFSMLGDLTLTPTQLLAPAQDVYLVQ
jgi:hypothetical protein